MQEVLYTFFDSPLGKIDIAVQSNMLRALWFDGKGRFFFLPHGAKYTECAAGERTKNWLEQYFSGRNPSFTPEMMLSGTPFRVAVWNLLLTVPYGSTVTYGELATLLAKKSGKRVAAQAIGGAVGHNPVSIIVPCHRVIGADGSLVGYDGGLEIKKRLLLLESENNRKLQKDSRE